ncbi:MAG: TIGR03960 family B12-binding radical SAM protein [Deltaproteobacteria bacterium]|nr:TIGR03960 family B12-binding radical SAM protein [Deltaproteobacteria bacterium]
MIDNKLQEILPFVKQPSRYMGSEINSVKKDYVDISASFILAFPDLYEIGTSHLGIQILYNILNKKKEIAAERVFAPDIDMVKLLKEKKILLSSLETGRLLKDFDIIGFSLLYELNYTNILLMLDLAGIPFFAKERKNTFPLIIGGGPCASNPEPIADFFDAFAIGDGEEVILEMTDALIRFKKEGARDKKELLYEWSKIEGVYIPSFFKADYKDGFSKLTPEHSHHKKIRRAIISDFDNAIFPEAPIIPYGKPVHDRLKIEVARGCGAGCRFCSAGMIYRPVREKSLKTLSEISAKSAASTGYEELSLLSLSIGDYGCLNSLIQQTVNFFAPQKVAVSLPSMRADSLTPEMMKLIKKIRKTGFTIAPEAGSQRLRDVVNKNISYEQIENTVLNAFGLGWQLIKLYFMIGLPTETDEDIFELIKLVKKIKAVLKEKKYHRGNINVSVSNFVPKAHTPFQWEAQLSISEVERRLNIIKDNLNISGIRVKWHDPKAGVLEGLFARGDRRLSRLLVSAYKNGCIFDGWSDYFNFNLWQKALNETGIDPNLYIYRQLKTDDPLCWDHVDTRVEKKFLIKELNNALAEKTTQNCKDHKCSECGVCDFKKIAPEIFTDCAEDLKEKKSADKSEEPIYKKYSLLFSKKDNAKFFGHLEMAKIFLRALKRGKIPLKFSSGFHPKPKVSFEDSLPLGMESESETMNITVLDGTTPRETVKSLNENLPDGLFIYDWKEYEKNIRLSEEIYEVILKEEIFDELKILDFKKSDSFIIKKINKKEKYKEIELKTVVKEIELKSDNKLRLVLKAHSGARPGLILKEAFGLSENIIKLAKIIKKRS